MEACFQGQNNGLCGAASPGSLHLVTGMHSGYVDFTLDVLDAAPPLNLSAWEEVVEATFTALDGPIVLSEWHGNVVCELPLVAGTYRVRYCACGVDQGNEVDTIVDGDSVDVYSLTFWPAPPAADAILKQTAEFASYQHRELGSGPKPSWMT